MSFDFQAVTVLAGAIASVVAGFGASYFKDLYQRTQKRERDKTEQAAQRQITEISFSIAGLRVSHQFEHPSAPQAQVATQLLKEVEQGIVQGVSDERGLSREQVTAEVDEKMSGLRERLQAIEKRFPDEASIDKIASINDALFAHRIDQLFDRIEKLERKVLTKWDVAIIVSVVATGIFAVVGATYAVLKVFGKVP